MRHKKMMGIGYLIPSSRKRPIAQEPLENGIRGITLRHIEDMRSPADYFVDIPSLRLPPEMGPWRFSCLQALIERSFPSSGAPIAPSNIP